MSYQLRIENPDTTNFITTRTRNSELWFTEFPAELKSEILGRLAKYQQHYQVQLYCIPIQGNHFHLIARFPSGNRAAFMRDFNSQFARLCKRFIPAMPMGPLWGRRYSNQTLDDDASIRKYFYYCALQAVHSGLTEHPEQYSGYNSLNESLNDTPTTYIVTDWTAYNNARRFNPKVPITRYQEAFQLTFSRLPGFDPALSSAEYRQQVLAEVERRRLELVKERTDAGKGFAGPVALAAIKPGTCPHQTKLSNRATKLVVSLACDLFTRERCREEYYTIKDTHRVASRKFLAGETSVTFPKGTYRPPSFTMPKLPSSPPPPPATAAGGGVAATPPS